MPQCHVLLQMRAVLNLVGQPQETGEIRQLTWASGEVVCMVLGKGSVFCAVRCWAILHVVVPGVGLHKGWMFSGSEGAATAEGLIFLWSLSTLHRWPTASSSPAF